MITDQQLTCIYPRSSAKDRSRYLPYINQYSALYGVGTDERMCAFLAQVGHESGQLRYVEELASGEAYEGRKDLGNVRAGDGARYKGRGLIQITGRANYTKLEKEWGIDLLNNPQLLCEPRYAVLSAYWYWKDRRLNRYATLDESDFRKLTKLINGGYNGYADRLAIWNRAKEQLL